MDDLLMERAEHSAAPELLLADKIAAAFELAEGLGYKIVLSFGAPALPAGGSGGGGTEDENRIALGNLRFVDRIVVDPRREQEEHPAGQREALVAGPKVLRALQTVVDLIAVVVNMPKFNAAFVQQLHIVDREIAGTHRHPDQLWIIKWVLLLVILHLFSHPYSVFSVKNIGLSGRMRCFHCITKEWQKKLFFLK